MEPGALEIIIPAYLWKTRPVRDDDGNIVTEGNEPGALYLSVPEEPEHGADFAWRRVGDKIIITNTHMMAGATRALIQGSFRGVIAHEMEDGTDSREYTTFNVEANLTTDSGRVLTRTGNMSEETTEENGTAVTKYEYTPIYATIDTYAAISSVNKTALRSARENEDYNTYGGRILGAEALIGTYNDGQTVKAADEDGRSITAVLYDGYNLSSKMAIIWVAYPKANFEEGKTVTVTNNASVTVTSYDDWREKTREGVDDNIRKSASATGTAPFRLPITYHVTKIWNQFNFELYEVTTDEEGNETETYVETAYANEDGTIFFAAFDFTNEDDGKTFVYRVYEIEDEREGEVIFDLEPITLTITVSDNGEGKLTAEVEKDREAFENYKVYALTVAKRVGAGADAGAEYSFTIKFTKDGEPFDPERLPDTWEKTGDGEYSFKLKDGESGRVSITANVTYTLTEESGEGYFASYEITSNNGAETVYGGGNVVTRTINGEFGSEKVTVVNSSAELEIAKKSDAEASDKNDEFTFEISFTYHGTPYELETMPDGWEKTGDGTYRLKLKAGESVRVKTSADVSYKVTENDRADYAESWTAEDATGEDRTAEGTVNNGKVEFMNVKLVGMKIRKLVNGSSTDKEKTFTFSVRFEKDGSVYAPDVPVTWTENEDGSYSFSLKDGEETEVWIADGVSYTVSESDAEAYVARYSVKSASGAETAMGEGKSVSGSVARSASGEDTVVFTNVGSAEIRISKRVVGPNANRTMKFSFELRLTLNGTAYDLERLPEGWTRKEAGVYEFTLAHDESAAVSVPLGTKFELTEAADERYSVKISVNGEETEGRSAEGTVTDPENGAEILVINRNEQIIPTGAEISSGIPMLLIPGLALTVILLKKRREREE